MKIIFVLHSFLPLHFVKTFILIWVIIPAYSQQYISNTKLIPAPEDEYLWDAWRDSLLLVREQTKKDIDYDDELYRQSSFQWASDCYVVYFLMLFDREFYDPQTNKFNVDDFVKNIENQFGKIDGLVLWHAYPRIGIDQRNQFDHYRDFPGGLNALKEIVKKFHELGIRIFIDFNPWDTGTRREGKDDIDILIDIVRIINADGIFLDTLTKGTKSFRNKLDAVKPGVVLESELALPVERVYDHHMSWAQWFDDSHVPGILWNKWLERRHMMHQIKRWEKNHLSELHMAWMNGSGILIWENVFGTWMPWNEQDKSYLRLMTPIQRHFSFLFQGEGWNPLYPVLMEDVYSSLWYDNHNKLWTIVNRSEEWKRGTIIKVAKQQNFRIFDLIRGIELKKPDTDSLEIRIDIAPRGLGAILITDFTDFEADFQEFLKAQRKKYARLSISTDIVKPKENQIRNDQKKVALNTIPENMVMIDEFSDQLKISYIQRECGFYAHDGYIPPPARIHQVVDFSKKIQLSAYAIDLTPVTNRQYYDFMMNTEYQPTDTSNFLKHWINGIPPEDFMDHPVVYVSLEDARAYAEWVGKRLPSENEWQLAAQGGMGITYPWGNEYDPDKCNHGQYAGTTPVKFFRQGRSPSGCYDMCGNTWEWTESERSDGHSQYVIIKGGSWFKADGSEWYVRGGPQPAGRSTKFILFWPGLDRSSTIGFRCVVDVID